jgi:hypothetical protein
VSKPPTEVIAIGTTTRVERMIRAHYPDGRIEDSKPRPAPDPANPHIAAGQNLADAFGRMLLPKGTRLERLERTITIHATPWAPIDADNSEENT